MRIYSIIRYTLLTASRDWLYVGIMFLSLIAISLSMFLGSVALSEQGYMASAFIGGGVRMIIIIGLTLFICFHVYRSFDNKEIELILTRPIGRVQFVLSYYFGFAVLALSMIVPIVICMALLAQAGLIWINYNGLVCWFFSFYCEILIIMAFAFAVSLIIHSAVMAVLATFAFYFVSRLIGFFLVSVNNPASTMHSGKYGYLLEKLLDAVAYLIPRLDLFSKSEWLVYGVVDYTQFSGLLLVTLVYVPLLLVIATSDFVRKQF